VVAVVWFFCSVLIPIVMEAEAGPFVEGLGLEPIEGFFPSHTPFRAFGGEHSSTRVTVVTMGKDGVYGTGVDNAGTVPASLAVYLAMDKLNLDQKVDLVMNAGTCGGFRRKGAAIGDVFLTNGVAHHDRRIPIPGFDKYGTGTLTAAEHGLLDPAPMAKALGFKTGICTTGNSLDYVEKDDELMQANEASVKDMEAAAIAWVAEMNGVPYLGVKVVTDIVDGEHPTQEEFLANLASAAESLQANLPKALDFVCASAPEQEL